MPGDALKDDEGPQRTVHISAPFAVGTFEVTGAQFQAFVRATGHRAGGLITGFRVAGPLTRDELN